MTASVKDIFKKSLCIYKNNFAKIAIILLAVWIPLVLIQVFVVDNSLDVEGLNELLKNSANLGAEEYESALLVSYRSMLIYLIMTLIISFFGIVSDIAIIKIASDSHKIESEKTATSFSDYFSDSVSILPRCIWILILTRLLVGAGLMFFVLPGIYIYIMSALALTATVLVGSRGLVSIKISFDIVKKELFTVALVMLSFIVLNWLVSVAFGTATGLISNNNYIKIAASAVTTLAGKYVTALQVIFFAVFFRERTVVVSTEHPQDTAPEAEQ